MEIIWQTWNTDISSDLVDVHQLCLIYFGDADMMFGCNGEATLKPKNNKNKMKDDINRGEKQI